MKETPSNELDTTHAAPSVSTEPSVKTADLRGFIDALTDVGRLVRINEATDWKCEIGKITRERPTALLFENIDGYPGQRVFTNGLCDTTSIALALGLKAGTARTTLIQEARSRMLWPVKPKLVETGPVLENIVQGSEIDLLKLPVPQWRRSEAGRYIGTWHINVSKDPETGVRNVGVYRMQLLNARQATVNATAGSHLFKHIAKYEKEGRPIPMAVAIGVSEAVIIAAGAAYPDGMDEYNLAGALQHGAVELIKCQTVDLEVPANSEFVIEGFIQPHVRVKDGPYFDFVGKLSTNPSAFLFEATRIMFRNDPIFRGASIGAPGAEDHQLFSFLAELNLVDFHSSRLQKMIQNLLLKKSLFRTFQLTDRVGAALYGVRARSASLMRRLAPKA